VNCHPVLLEYLCKKHQKPCPYLSEYVKNRDQIIAGPNRDQLKDVFLSIMNGGSKAFNDLKNPSMFLKKYRDEMTILHDEFYKRRDKKRYADLVKKREDKGKDYNHRATYMQSLLFEEENNCLMTILKFYKNPDVAVLCFDGLMIPKNESGDYMINECQKYVKRKCGINITLKIKEMNEGFDLTGQVIPDYMTSEILREEKKKTLETMIEVAIKDNEINDKRLSMIFSEALKNEIITINENGDGYLWNRKALLWEEKYAKELQVKICEDDSLILVVLRELKQKTLNTMDEKDTKEKAKKDTLRLRQIESIIHKVQTTRTIREIFQFTSVELLNTTFKEKVINRSHDLLPLRHGKVINLKH